MRGILQPGRTCLGTFDVEATGLLVDGRDYYRAFHQAARRAERYILMAGWQFDSGVRLLRGADTGEAGAEDIPTDLRGFLNDLCKKTADLRVYMLAWDFSLLFSLEREWLQEWVFNWTTHERLQFRFDGKHAVGASHHEKLVVVDGAIAFVGGMDVCADRWDDRRHLPEHPERVDPEGARYGPYHDIQSYHVGPAAAALAERFAERWERSGGEPLELPDPGDPKGFPIDGGQALQAARVAFSRTQAQTLVPAQPSIREIRRLYLEAIGSAESLLYLENQYFSSRAIYRALIDRMQAPDRPRLNIVILIPYRPKAFIEEISSGIAQSQMLSSLLGVARRTGHALGVYYRLSAPGEDRPPTYIHAKLLLVDDRFLTVGSANTTNRSMGLDTELNASWEEDDAEGRLSRSIRDIRVSLLSEHTGVRGGEARARLSTREDLVALLDELVERPECPLKRHGSDSLQLAAATWMEELNLESFSLDPEDAIVEAKLFELLSRDRTGLFAQGITRLNEWLAGKRKEEEPDPA